VLSTTDRNGLTTTYTYDTRGRRLTKNVGGAIESYGYDADGHLTTMTDARGGVATNSYDAAGRITSVTDPKGNTVVYTLDLDGNITREDTKNSAGTIVKSIVRTFDALGRVSSEYVGQ
jgi:YD repeat-containing protein